MCDINNWSASYNSYNYQTPIAAMDKRLSISVFTNMHKRLRIASAIADQSMNTSVVKALEMYLQHLEKSTDDGSK